MRDYVVRHANYDEDKEWVEITGQKSKQGPRMGKSFFPPDERKNYTDFEQMFPTIVNSVTLAKVLQEMKGKIRKIPQNRSNEMGMRKKLMEEFKNIDAPLQNWILKIKRALRSEVYNEMDGNAVAEVNQNSVMILDAEDNMGTTHSFIVMDMVGDSLLEVLDDNTNNFTAAHVHLPENMGEGNDLVDALTQFFLNLKYGTNSEELVVKVRKLHFESLKKQQRFSILTKTTAFFSSEKSTCFSRN